MATLRATRNFSIAKVRGLLQASHVDLQDARAPAQYVSARRRFDAAYDAAHACVLALLEANKLETEGLGHHKEGFQHLMQTLKLKGPTADNVLQYISVRHAGRYAGTATVDEAAVAAVIAWADRIQAETPRCP